MNLGYLLVPYANLTLLHIVNYTPTFKYSRPANEPFIFCSRMKARKGKSIGTQRAASSEKNAPLNI